MRSQASEPESDSPVVACADGHFGEGLPQGMTLAGVSQKRRRTSGLWRSR